MNRILFPVAVVCAILAGIRKKEEIGGWLFYFYYWIFAMLFIYVRDVALNWRAFVNLQLSSPAARPALYLAAFPRLAALFVVLGVALGLLRARNEEWLERLRMALLVAGIVSAASVWIDAGYFPDSVRNNAARLLGMVLWLAYFHMSQRVRAVFVVHNWQGQFDGTGVGPKGPFLSDPR